MQFEIQNRWPTVASVVLLLWASGLVGCGLLGCGSPPETAAEASESSEASIPANAVSGAEVADGWVSLFDGTSLDGWRGYQMEDLPAGWSVSDGTIHFVPPQEGERADLVTVAQYGDFELALEWAVTPGANSGVFFRVSEDQERAYYTGPEIQVLDDDGHPDGKKPETSAGSNYAIHAPAEYPKRPVGEFNEMRLRVQGPHVEQWMNGVKVVEYDLWTDQWKALVEASKFKQWPSYGMNETGHIVLQDHGNEIWFRNIRIREL